MLTFEVCHGVATLCLAQRCFTFDISYVHGNLHQVVLITTFRC